MHDIDLFTINSVECPSFNKPQKPHALSNKLLHNGSVSLPVDAEAEALRLALSLDTHYVHEDKQEKMTAADKAGVLRQGSLLRARKTLSLSLNDTCLFTKSRTKNGDMQRRWVQGKVLLVDHTRLEYAAYCATTE
jgi:hypothetical protein